MDKPHTVTVVLGLAAALAACGGDPPQCERDGGEACFQLPAEPLYGHSPGSTGSPADLGCGPIEPIASSMPVTMNGRVVDTDSNQAVSGGLVEIFDADDYVNPIATGTTDDAGDYSLTLAIDTPDLLWGKISGGGVAVQLQHQLRPDLSESTLDVDFLTVTPENLGEVARNVGVEPHDGLGRLVAFVYDCARRPTSNAVVVLSATSGERDFVDGVPVLYSVTGDLAYPVPHADRAVTSQGGNALVFNTPVDGDLYLQAWGFPDAAAVAEGDAGLVLIAEHTVASRAGARTWVNLWANRD